LIVKIIVFLFGKLTPQQKQTLLDVLTQLVKAGTSGVVEGAMHSK